MAEIQLRNGGVAVVDSADLDWLSQWSWSRQRSAVAEERWYAKRSEYRNGRSATIYMHREILNPPPGFVPDHINRDGLDNRRVNLRVATSAQNTRLAVHRPTISGYRGVKPYRGKWVAYIVQRRSADPRDVKYRTFGTFADPVDAARAYDRASRELFGDFGFQNFKDGA